MFIKPWYPKYPVVHPYPSGIMIRSCWTFKDILVMAGVSATFWTVSFFHARQNFIRLRTFRRVLPLIFFSWGYLHHEYANRLRGLRPNDAEVKRFGFYTADELDKYLRSHNANHGREALGQLVEEKEWKSL
mmetsp:Transcript_6210/g.9362  ORF Transcript_6210/g.9362 Transcript_6210/m.9362 type:complete len:131 (-) Transcript_6210:129-521(-)